jgi:hypothetical protein
MSSQFEFSRIDPQCIQVAMLYFDSMDPQCMIGGHDFVYDVISL